jgi:opacity protein-like surface antigen
MKIKFLLAAVAAVAIGSAAQAAQYVQNGGFEDATYTANSQVGRAGYGQGIADWTAGSGLELYYIGGTQTTVSASDEYNDPQTYFYPTFNTLSPNGGNFVALDGDSDIPGAIWQYVSGLTPGNSYTLTFDWAASQLINRSGDITESLVVALEDHTNNTTQSYTTSVVPVASGQFSGWMTETMTFKATNSNEVLSFLSVGTPNGQPPIAVLDGVSLTDGVPEPAAWALMLMGFGGVGLMVRRNRRKALAAVA